MRSIWGVVVRKRTICHTDFVCPRCGVDRVGNHVEPQRWFVVAGVAVIPLATLPGEVVCETCGHTADVSVLDVPTTAQLAELLEMAVRSSIAVILRSVFDGDRIGAGASHVARSIMAAEGHVCDEAQLIRDMTDLDVNHARASLSRLIAELTPHGKQAFLHRIASIALADGPMNEPQRQVLQEIGVALGMSAPNVNGVITMAELETEAA